VILPPLDLAKLKALAHEQWIQGLTPAGGNTEVWYQAITRYLGGLGIIIIPKEVRELELEIFRRGWGSEYITHLVHHVRRPEGLRKSGYEAVAIASTEDRLEGIDYVLTKHPEALLELPRYLKLALSRIKA